MTVAGETQRTPSTKLRRLEMAIFDGIFQRYRNGNRGVLVQHGVQQP